KTITDHIAVLRPHAWLMLGHCAGLRSSQQLGDYVLAHAYVREDHVLDEELPIWVPIPALAEIQLALEKAVADITRTEGADRERVDQHLRIGMRAIEILRAGGSQRLHSRKLRSFDEVAFQ